MEVKYFCMYLLILLCVIIAEKLLLIIRKEKRTIERTTSDSFHLPYEIHKVSK